MDKSSLLRQIAAFVCIKLVQALQQKQQLLNQRNEEQKHGLLPAQVKYAQATLVQTFAMVKRIALTFFSGP